MPNKPKTKSRAKTAKYVVTVVMNTSRPVSKTEVRDWLDCAMREAQEVIVAAGTPPVMLTAFRVRSVDID